jgi:hypothetical protein
MTGRLALFWANTEVGQIIPAAAAKVMKSRRLIVAPRTGRLYRIEQLRRKGQMSALGQKQTCAAQKIMSTLPPKADVGGATSDVRLVPIADIASVIRSPRPRGQGAREGL